MLIGPSATRRSYVDYRSRPPARDAGNRISFAGLRGFAETRDSELPVDADLAVAPAREAVDSI
jgi:hypothetical protein